MISNMYSLSFSDEKENTPVVPIIRSYDGLLWESAAGEVAMSIFYDEPISC